MNGRNTLYADHQGHTQPDSRHYNIFTRGTKSTHGIGELKWDGE